MSFWHFGLRWLRNLAQKKVEADVVMLRNWLTNNVDMVMRTKVEADVYRLGIRAMSATPVAMAINAHLATMTMLVFSVFVCVTWQKLSEDKTVVLETCTYPYLRPAPTRTLSISIRMDSIDGAGDIYGTTMTFLDIRYS